MSKEDEWLRCTEKLCECLKQFKHANVKLEGYLNHTAIARDIQDMQTSMNHILEQLEKKR